jgi:hypothetical protein
MGFLTQFRKMVALEFFRHRSETQSGSWRPRLEVSELETALGLRLATLPATIATLGL